MPEKGSQPSSARHRLGCLVGHHSPLWVLSPPPLPLLSPLKLCLSHDRAADGYCQPDSSWRGRNRDPELQGPSLDEAHPWRRQGPSPQSCCQEPDTESPPGRALHPQVLWKTRSWGGTLRGDEAPQNGLCSSFQAPAPLSRLRSLNLRP